MKVLVIDNYDSFVYNIVGYLKKLGAEVDTVANDRLEEVKDIRKYHSVVISPGPGNPLNEKDRGGIIEFLDKNRDKKVLGICFGHQLLGYYLGSKIKMSPRVLHGELDRIRHSGGPLYMNVPKTFTSIRYHSLIIEPNANIVVDSVSETDGSVMGFHSHDHRYFGLQFHPESFYSEYGETILSNFLVM